MFIYFRREARYQGLEVYQRRPLTVTYQNRDANIRRGGLGLQITGR